MDEQQKHALAQEVAGYLAQGASPEEVAQALEEQNVPEQDIPEIIQMAAQMAQQGGGGQGQGGGALEALAQENPQVLLQLLTEWEQMAPEEKQQIMQALSQEGGAPAETPQSAPQGSGMFY